MKPLAKARIQEIAERWADLVTNAVSEVQPGLWRRTRTSENCDDGHPLVTSRLRSWIYLDAHLGTDESAMTNSQGDDHEVASRLSSLANSRWPSAGWKVRSNGDGATIAEKNGVELSISSDDMLSPDGSRGQDQQTILLPRVRPSALPGWCSVYSSRGPASGRSTRIYLHPSTLSSLGPITAALDTLASPWSFKVSTTAGGLERPDAAVVYLASGDIEPAVDCLVGLARDPSLFSSTTPGFSLRLAKGIALGASDPQDAGGSFGARVSHMAALALRDRTPVLEAIAPYARQMSCP